MWATIIELFRNYMGTGLILAWFLIAVVYLYFKEEDKGKRILFLYVPVIVFLLFFNPLFIKIVYGLVGSEIYYRVLWLLPVTIVLAYTITCVFTKLHSVKAKIFLGLSLLLVMVSGGCIYLNAGFSKADNLHHIPQEVVEICDAIEVEGREIMAVFPDEMIPYVRQYSAVVCMPYGREALVEQWNNDDDLHVIMEADVVDVEMLAQLAKEDSCHYIILHKEKELLGNMEDYEYILFDTIGDYNIYLDTTIYIGL